MENLPAVTVAAIIERDGKFLMVQEVDKDGRTIYNQPAGHLEPHEDILQAVVREVYEETGLHFTPESLVGTYLLESERTGKTYLRFCFAGTVPVEDARPQDSDIVEAHWLTKEEIEQVRQYWRSDIVKKCLQDYAEGHRYPLTLVQSFIGEDSL